MSVDLMHVNLAERDKPVEQRDRCGLRFSYGVVIVPGDARLSKKICVRSPIYV